MKQIKTIKFPNDAETYEIVDAQARQDMETIPNWAKELSKPDYTWDEINDKPFTNGKINLECLPDDITASTFTGSGAALTDLNAANISSGVLAATNGGTGQSTLVDSANALINALESGTAAPTDDTCIITQGTGNGYSDKFYKKPASSLWNYIKSKADKVYGTSSGLQAVTGTLSTTSTTTQTVTVGFKPKVIWLYDVADPDDLDTYSQFYLWFVNAGYLKHYYTDSKEQVNYDSGAPANFSVTSTGFKFKNRYYSSYKYMAIG